MANCQRRRNEVPDPAALIEDGDDEKHDGRHDQPEVNGPVLIIEHRQSDGRFPSGAAVKIH